MSSGNNLPGYNPQGQLATDSSGNALPWQQQTPMALGEQGYQNSQTQKGKNQAYNQQQYMDAAHPNTSTGTGSQSWHQDPKTGTWSESNTLNGGLASGQANLSSQIGAQGPIGNGDQARDQAISGAYNQATSRLNPQWAQSNEQLGQQLASEGLDPNSQAYRNAMLTQSQAQNDAYGSAMNSAIGQGTAAQQATFGENYQASMAPYQQLASLNNLYSQGDASGLAGLQAANGYTAQQNAASGQAIGTGVAAAGSIIGTASDERVKQNIHRLPVEAAPGVPLATFEYKHAPGKTYAGVIAQDLEEEHPEHVTTGPDGIKRVSAPFVPFVVGTTRKK